MGNILADIVAQKRLEIKGLYADHDFQQLEKELLAGAENTMPAVPHFYTALSTSRNPQAPFFITEFKRKSPSEGWINRDANLPEQVMAYAQAGAGAISVLTDTAFFGGSYSDLALAAATLKKLPTRNRPLLLQKDFVLDPIQIYLAKNQGADIILLIAAILQPEELEMLRLTAESVGLGVLVEVHDREELEGIRHLDFRVLGVNNRDLKTFRTALNRVNVLAPYSGDRFIIAESGLRDYRDFQVVRNADGFLIGTSLMRSWSDRSEDSDLTFAQYFQTAGRALFKACGIRTPEVLHKAHADYLGINFSPLSRRRPDAATLLALKNRLDFPAHLVAVFYQNTEGEIRATLAQYPFEMVQLYAHDVSPDFVRSLRQKVMLACAVRSPEDLWRLEEFAADVDFFILDGAVPGSGQGVTTTIPPDFPYPFLLAGGLQLDHLDQVSAYKNCIGVDIASGLETDGQIDLKKVSAINEKLSGPQKLSTTINLRDKKR